MSKLARLASAFAAISLIGASGSAVAQARISPPAGTPEATQHLNPNTATEAQIRAIPGVSAELAADIARGRPYAGQAALHRVIGAKVPAAQQPAIYASIFVPVKLNTATDEELRTIPGMTERMLHEFKEYRPYRDMTVFRREIGKYVTETELNRLASYVTVQ